jgi:hypothetical protein
MNIEIAVHVAIIALLIYALFRAFVTGRVVRFMTGAEPLSAMASRKYDPVSFWIVIAALIICLVLTIGFLCNLLFGFTLT